jgi:hypothetical protein
MLISVKLTTDIYGRQDNKSSLPLALAPLSLPAFGEG